MATSKQYSADISIHGSVNPDLQRATGFTQAQLARLWKSANELNKLFSIGQKNALGLSPALKKSEQAMASLNRSANSFHDGE